MKSKSLRSGIAAAVGMLILILDAQTAMEGVRSGIDICLKTLIPSLFPLFVLSIYMTGNLSGRNIKLMNPICRLCGIPEGAESLLLTGLWGGYPVGAQSVALALEQGSLSESDARRMLAFCNNAGPAFIFGIIGSAFDSPLLPLGLWIIHITSAILVGMITRHTARASVTALQPVAITLTQALQKAIRVMAQVSAWVILFRLFLSYLERWFLWMLPVTFQVIVSGLLELSNGCVQLQRVESESLRFITASAFLSFGGLCVILQTRSVTGGLSLQHYFPGKLLQTLLSILMASGYQLCISGGSRSVVNIGSFLFVCLLTGIVIYFFRKTQNNSSNPLSIGV